MKIKTETIAYITDEAGIVHEVLCDQSVTYAEPPGFGYRIFHCICHTRNYFIADYLGDEVRRFSESDWERLK